MQDSQDILRVRVLLCFLKDHACTVTSIARTLGEEKYTISRMLISMEKAGLIDRKEKRGPKLTESGKQKAAYYEERIAVIINHLLYEGLDTENARKDAFNWALYTSEEAMNTIRATEERYRVKYELRDRKNFSGAMFCRKLRNGSYRFPFLIYREHVQQGSNLSMANEGFEHPCTLYVENGAGMIQLRAVPLTARSAADGTFMRGKVKSVKYFESGSYVEAEASGNLISFPASALKFVNVGDGVGQILHGSVCLKMECTAGTLHMPESRAIFTILI